MNLLSKLTVILSLIVLSAHAQTQQEQFQAYAYRVLAEQNAQLTANKTTGQQRIISIRSLDNTNKMDSTLFMYAGSHGSEFDFYNMDYNWGYNPQQPSVFPFIYAGPEFLADSVAWIQYNQMGDTAPLRRIFTKYDFTNADDVLSSKPIGYYGAQLTATQWDRNVYSIAGKLLKTYSMKMNIATAGWDSAFIATYTYDAQGMLIADTVLKRASPTTWVPGNVYSFSYNAAGKMSTSTWKVNNGSAMTDYMVNTFTYNSSNLVTTLTQVMIAMSLKDSFIYNNNNNQVQTILLQQKQQPSLVFKPLNFDERIIPASGLTSARYLGGYNATSLLRDTQVMHHYTYNSFNNPVFDTTFQWGTLAVNAVTTYRYEEFTAITETPHTVAAKLYPNPAKDALYLEAAVPYKRATVKIYNTAGSCVGNGTFYNSERMQLYIAGLSPGMYYYKATFDGAGVSDGKFMVEK